MNAKQRDYQLNAIRGRMSHLETQYTANDARRLREYRAGGVSLATAIKHAQICTDIEVAYRRYEQLLAERV